MLDSLIVFLQYRWECLLSLFWFVRLMLNAGLSLNLTLCKAFIETCLWPFSETLATTLTDTALCCSLLSDMSEMQVWKCGSPCLCNTLWLQETHTSYPALPWCLCNRSRLFSLLTEWPNVTTIDRSSFPRLRWPSHNAAFQRTKCLCSWTRPLHCMWMCVIWTGNPWDKTCLRKFSEALLLRQCGFFSQAMLKHMEPKCVGLFVTGKTDRLMPPMMKSLVYFSVVDHIHILTQSREYAASLSCASWIMWKMLWETCDVNNIRNLEVTLLTHQKIDL